MERVAAPIRILVADDHPLMRLGIAGEISSQQGMVVVAEAATGIDAVDAFRKHHPDVSLIDLRMPEKHGIQVIEEIRALCPEAKIVVLTTVSGDAQIVRAFRAGASAYLLKNMLRMELTDTIRIVASGRKKLPDPVAAHLAQHAFDHDLSPRELDVLQCAARGKSNKMIADHLQLSEHTVKGHIKSILVKLRANDRTHAVTIALARGFFELHGSC